jgi:hypothetical protein
MSDEQPGWLVEPRENRPAEGQTPSPAEPEIEVGQIWIAQPDTGPGVCLLLIEVHDGHVQGLLCGEECHLATETDAVLEPGVTGYPRRLLVHGDLSAAILKPRLARAVGEVGQDLVERITRRGRGLDFNSSDLGRGTAIVADDDPRSDWKLERLRDLRGVRARASELGWQIRKLGE